MSFVIIILLAACGKGAANVETNLPTEEMIPTMASVTELPDTQPVDTEPPAAEPPASESSPVEIPEGAELLSKEEGYTLYRVQISTVQNLKLTGLFFRLDTDEKKPLVIVQHGGLGTPEMISGMYGKTSNYNDMLMRVLERGVNVFAPQLLIWNPKDRGADFDRAHIDANLKRVGSSIAALEIYGITRVLDYFEAQDYVTKIGMVGLSYGGFYTLFTTAVDTRIKSAISCSYFNDRDEHIFTNWAWKNSALMFNDAEVACLVYPRRICLQMGDKDELFNADFSIRSFERVKEIAKDIGTDWAELVIFDGKHEFCKDDRYIDRLIEDLK